MPKLTVWRPIVHQSRCIDSPGERIGEQQEQRHNETIDSHCLDHGETDEKCPGYCPRRLRLPCDRVHGGGHRATLARAGPIDPIETAMTAPMIEMSLGSIKPPYPFATLPTAAPMK